MKEIVVKAKLRETGKKVSKKYRREGLVTGNYYMKGAENISFLTDTLSLRPIVYSPLRKIILLDIEGQKAPIKCILKDISFDPMTEQIVHFDVIGIKDDQIVTVELPFKLVGQPKGVLQGGTLQAAMRNVKVNCLPKDMRESLEIDVTELSVGQTKYVRDLTDVDGLEFLVNSNTAICMVNKPRVIAELDEEEAAAEAAETAETTTTEE